MVASPHTSSRSIVRCADGEPLVGFAKEFIRESIKATMKFPQTQAVIKLAVGKVIMEALIDKRCLEISETYQDLQNETNQTIDLGAVQKFVENLYSKLGIKIHRISTKSLSKLFQFEIRSALDQIVSLARRYGKGEDAKIATKAATLSEDVSLENPFPQIDAVLEQINLLSPALKNGIKTILSEAAEEMCKHVEASSLLNQLVEGLKSHVKKDWEMAVIFPYNSRVTKLAMCAEAESSERYFRLNTVQESPSANKID